MKILIFADVHHRTAVSDRRKKKTLAGVKRVIDRTPCDLIVFLGDILHGPDFQSLPEYEAYLREVLDLTGNIPFATVFGNHDDECSITKEEILAVIQRYPNARTQGCHYVLEMMGETLLFIDSGSYYDGPESGYDTVKQETIDFAKSQIEGKRAILFQHIIMPDINDLVVRGKHPRFKEGVRYTGRLKENPCPPDINTGELRQLAPYLKAAVFAHDHKNSFETDVMGVRFIQCPGCGYNSYEKLCRRGVKLLDTETMQTTLIDVKTLKTR